MGIKEGLALLNQIAFQELGPYPKERPARRHTLRYQLKKIQRKNQCSLKKAFEIYRSGR